MICVNCSTEHNGNFCPNCGERSQVPKITFSSILNNAFATITNMDKGFLFNVKNLFLHPGQLISDYLRGKRKQIFNPISFLIISVTVYLVVDSLVKVPVTGDKIESEIYDVGYQSGRFIKLYFKYFWLLSIIWLSVSTRIFFGKYNYAEHLALNSFVIGQATLVGIIGFLIFKVPILFNPFVYSMILWMLYQIFKSKKKDWEALLVSFAAVLLFFVQLIVITILIGVVRSKM
jgi:hypothetical protein